MIPTTLTVEERTILRGWSPNRYKTLAPTDARLATYERLAEWGALDDESSRVTGTLRAFSLGFAGRVIRELLLEEPENPLG